MMIQKFLPVSASQTKVHYEVYRNKDSSEQDFRTIADTYARVMKEDKALCDRAQANLNAGVFINGELHPRWEKGPFDQALLLPRVLDPLTLIHQQVPCTSSRKSAKPSPNISSERNLRAGRSGRQGNSCPKTPSVNPIKRFVTVLRAVVRCLAFCLGEAFTWRAN